MRLGLVAPLFLVFSTLNSGFFLSVQAQTVVALNPTTRTDAPADAAEAPKLNVINTAQSNPVSPAVEAYARRFADDPDALVRLASRLYAQAGGQALWYRPGGWSAGAQDAFRILDQADYDGLPSDAYLAKIDGGLDDIRTNREAAVADFALTLGLLRFALDLKFGLGHEVAPGEIGEGFKEAYLAQSLDAWIDTFRPETPLYLRLHKALLLGELTPKQAQKAALTMHRERSPLLVHPDRHIIVDLGLQQLKVYEDRKEMLAMPVIVGKPERRTPLLSDEIVNLKFSPDWSVPPVIAREDILPILQTTPDVIGDMGIDILDDENRKVIATSVDWSEVDPYKIPFRFRMKPGIDNLLGGVRFSLTNDFAIYLHDSPERDRYASGVRTFSSGCVRVGDAATLASWIMGRQKNWKRTDVIAAMVKGKTQIEKLPDPIKVDFIYSTVGFSEDGRLMFKPDIYGEDARLARRIGLDQSNDVPPPLPKVRG